MRVHKAPIWMESVFHVLAHVDAGAIAASCFDRAYIAWAADKLGPATATTTGDGERSLAQDALLIAQAAATHDALARVQALAWVFDSVDQITRVEDRELASLDATDVASPAALATAVSAGPIVEVLRAAAELELPLLASLGDAGISEDDDDVQPALDAVRAAAPALADYDVLLARPLGLRGRVVGRSIVVGVPGISCPDAEHLAWQAAHEATVGAVVMAEPRLSFHDLERKAIGLLRSRARSAGLGDAHGRWLARLDLRALGSIPDVDDTPE